jgi:hypothetical protein
MSRAPHDSITRALPGDEHAALRRTLRRRLARVLDVLPDGYEARIGPDGFDLLDIDHEREALERVLRSLAGDLLEGLGERE